jgi:arylsulfatase
MRLLITVVGLVTLAIAVALTASAESKKPNIVIIWGDDIGQSNISALVLSERRTH